MVPLLPISSRLVLLSALLASSNQLAKLPPVSLQKRSIAPLACEDQFVELQS
jgi:hypothetical protein